MKQNPSKTGAAIKRVASVTFTFMCPWEWARQERETFLIFSAAFGERDRALGSSHPHFPIWRMDLGVDRRMRHKKKEKRKRKKRVPYVCLFLFISSQPNRSTSSAAWLKLMLLEMSGRTQFIHIRTWHRKHDCSQRLWHCLEDTLWNIYDV